MLSLLLSVTDRSSYESLKKHEAYETTRGGRRGGGGGGVGTAIRNCIIFCNRNRSETLLGVPLSLSVAVSLLAFFFL